MLRKVKAAQYVANNDGEVCPADWSKGKSGMKESHEGVADYLSSN
jgi:peroxiredoxin (alkyl hydroperoxide reductase subunit C)